MNEQARKRLKYLKGFCHDSTIALRASEKCGKVFPSIKTVATLYSIVEEVIEICLAEPG